MGRIHISNIEKDLHEKIKKIAKSEGKSVSLFIIEILCNHINYSVKVSPLIKKFSNNERKVLILLADNYPECFYQNQLIKLSKSGIDIVEDSIRGFIIKGEANGLIESVTTKNGRLPNGILVKDKRAKYYIATKKGIELSNKIGDMNKK